MKPDGDGRMHWNRQGYRGRQAVHGHGRPRAGRPIEGSKRRHHRNGRDKWLDGVLWVERAEPVAREVRAAQGVREVQEVRVAQVVQVVPARWAMPSPTR
jgi:hypothetical protein